VRNDSPGDSLPWSALFAQLAEDRARVQAGLPPSATSDQAWSELARRLRVIALAARRGLPPDIHSDPDDLVQDLLLRLQLPIELERLLGVKHPSAYLHRMIRHAAIDSVRRARRQHRLDAREDDLVDSRASDLWRIGQISAAIKRLPYETQLLLRWKFWEGVSTRECAKRLGISYSAAAVRIHRALRGLRGPEGLA
jgi:RNA polymerase sigma factor (sigma-70 family)